ncbi:MAG: hypothetical protein H0V66_12140, partial [Bdellovibrionales bacterium]|nr:hypothetical protein [Bdellovibrionales bacterium]
MSSEISSLYQDIRSNLETSRKALITTSISGDEESPGIRSLEEAGVVLDTLESIAVDAKILVDQFPSLESLYEKNFGKLRELYDRAAIIETAMVDEFIFPATSNYSFMIDGEFSSEVAASYKDIFKAWTEEKVAKHTATQELVKVNFDLKLSDRDLTCQCVQCLGDYRAQIRESVYSLQIVLIDQAEEKLHDWILTKRITDVSGAVFNLKRDLEKNFHNMRNKLKRSSVNKLETEVKTYFRDKFGAKSDLGKVYKEKLNVFFNTLLVEQGLKPE